MTFISTSAIENWLPIVMFPNAYDSPAATGEKSIFSFAYHADGKAAALPQMSLSRGY